VGVRDLALGAHDPLAHRRLGDEEGARDLARRQAAERPERESDPRRHVQGRVAAGEDQPQPIVGDGAGLGHVVVLVRVEAHQLGQTLGAIGHRAVAAQAVDRPPPRRDGEPRARPGGNAVARPRGEGGGEGVLHRVLGQLEVADVADEGGQHGGALLAKGAGDRGGGVVRAHGSPSGRTSCHMGSGITALAVRTEYDARRAVISTSGVGWEGHDLHAVAARRGDE
jgi:hypothetical protein